MSAADAVTAAAVSTGSVPAALEAQLQKLRLSQQHAFLPWKHLSAAHLTHLASLPPGPARRAALSNILRLEERFPLGQQGALRRDEQATRRQRQEQQQRDQTEQDTNQTRRDIIVDLALGVLGFCWTHELSALKTSTFFSILYTVHQRVAETPSGPSPSLAAAAALFDKLLLQHALERPPFSICCFSAPDVALLSEYFGATYLRHLRMYQFVFATRNELELVVRNSEAECVDKDRIGEPEVVRPIAQMLGMSEGGDAGDARPESAVPTTASTPATAAPATASAPAGAASAVAGAPAVAAAPAPWWSLDHARSYFPHAPGQSTSWGALPLSSATGLDMTVKGGGDEQLFDEDECDEDEFKDSASVADYLESQAAAADALALRVASGDALGDGPLLSNPEDQALFERAMSRELGGLTRDFHAQLKAQQEAFARRIAELDQAANGVNGANGTDTGKEGSSSGRAGIGSADKGRSKSRAGRV